MKEDVKGKQRKFHTENDTAAFSTCDNTPFTLIYAVSGTDSYLYAVHMSNVIAVTLNFYVLFRSFCTL